jgi:transposase
MERRRFTREFKVEAVKLVRERGVAVRQAARDLSVHENVLRKWVKEFGADPQQAFPGHGQMKPEQLEIERIGNKTYRTRNEARADLFDYIERFYNAKRRHSTIGYLSPMEFERKAGLAYIVLVILLVSGGWYGRGRWY